MSLNESSRPSGGGTVVRSDQPTFIHEQEQKYRRRYKEGFDLPDEEYEAWLKINHPGHTTTCNISTRAQLLYGNGSSKSADQVGASSDMQPMKSSLWNVKRLHSQKWKNGSLQEGCDLPDEKYKAWLKINHPEDTRAGNNSDLQ